VVGYKTLIVTDYFRWNEIIVRRLPPMSWMMKWKRLSGLQGYELLIEP